MKMLPNYTLKELVKENVEFVQYRKGELVYSTTHTGFVFVVPVSGCGDAEFKAQDRGVFFRRWIRKQLEANNQGKEQF